MASFRETGYHVYYSKSNPGPYLLVGVELLIDHHAEELELSQRLAGAEHVD